MVYWGFGIDYLGFKNRSRSKSSPSGGIAISPTSGVSPAVILQMSSVVLWLRESSKVPIGKPPTAVAIGNKQCRWFSFEVACPDHFIIMHDAP